MAKKYIDAAVTTEKDSMTVADGTALTLTNGVRVLYDDTLSTADLYVALTRVRDKIVENEQ